MQGFKTQIGFFWHMPCLTAPAWLWQDPSPCLVLRWLHGMHLDGRRCRSGGVLNLGCGDFKQVALILRIMRGRARAKERGKPALPSSLPIEKGKEVFPL